MSNTQPYTVMTVCTGNICRSPMGEIILRHFFNERGLPAGKRAEVHMYRSFDPNLPKPKPGREDQIDLVDPWYGGKHEFEVAIDQIEEVAPYIVDWVAKQL